ncbi:hypothetical protein HYC85_015075 [Camellia sinensis]|uniref:Cellulose synthase n=1 Tax=Camellia sinensis TaxID=4442 RepID=A0A7J7HBB7_CAMSI|nr:hypothetical protein HYC85_015075 [Camellia sinensis]
MGRAGEGEEEGLPLFETRVGKKSRVAYRIFGFTVFIGICMIWVYRLTHIPTAEQGRWAWIGMFMAELWFGFYWIITLSARLNVTYRYPFKHRLITRYGDKLPAVDIFVCTADAEIEPPTMVINTVLSVMSYDYPPEKLSIYLSDDGGSEFTFYALMEASQFSKHWIPFCKKFRVEPRSPAAYFSQNFNQQDPKLAEEWLATKILIDGRKPSAVDEDGHQLPTLVYLAREKRPQCPHNIKAGSMNALIRVSSEISNAPIILNLDCDMYSNDSDAIKEALCFFMDEKHGHKTSHVQHPQSCNNITKNDIFSRQC